ncbi:MAG: hypothetical protein ACTSQS_11555 [Promethearchaeota archaeon]
MKSKSIYGISERIRTLLSIVHYNIPTEMKFPSVAEFIRTSIILELKCKQIKEKIDNYYRVQKTLIKGDI